MWTPGVEFAAVDPARTIMVIVEPLYLGVAAALALDAGWGSVELALRADAAPIPLVSFEQRPTKPGGRCRVRGDVHDVTAVVPNLVATDDDIPARDKLSELAPPIVVLGSIVNALPLTSRLARADADAIAFVPAASDGDVSGEAWWACGVLVRSLLEEVEGRDCVLDDAAGIAVSLAGDEEDDARSALATGAGWRRHAELGGSEDDLRVAAARDSVGAIPRVIERTHDSLVVTQW
jgi:hypothetical protein